MTNKYYDPSGQPVALSRGASAAIRAEFSAVQAGLNLVESDLAAALATGNFKLIYQGALANDPTARYDGTALQDGDLYTNTIDKVLKSYAGGQWYAIPTSSSVLPKSGGALTGPLLGTTAVFSGVVKGAGFEGNGAALTGLLLTQIVAALAYTPANRAGDTFTGAISGTNATFSGTLSGGTVQQTSDERKKKKWQRLPADFIAQMAKIKKSGLFFWKKGNRPGLGVGAQSLAEILPQVVHADEHGNLSVEYGAAALVTCIELCREVVALRAELERLK